MTDFLQRLKQRKLVQWAIAYVAGAWALLQVLDLVGQEFGWPGVVMRIVTVALGIGFFVALVLAWYHGERGAQRVGGIELMMLAALLVIAAVAVSWVRHSHDHAAAQVAAVHTPADTTSAISAVAPVVNAPRVAGKTVTRVIPAKSIAVLPFENLSVDKGNKYFADGMQDLILTKLADISDLKVISRTSTMKYASHPDDVETIAQQLGVATILEGSVQKAGNQVLINVQLIDARSDNHLWAASYTRNLTNIFGVEGEVAGKVADALKAKLSPAEALAVAKAPTTNPEAYTLYLKAQEQIQQFYQGDARPERAEQAIADLTQAVKDDPQFALAWAWLGRMQNSLVMNHMRDTPQLRAGALASVQKALALQPDLALAHESLGSIDGVRGDYKQAFEQYAVARRLAPNDADVAEKTAEASAVIGDWAQAGSEIARAVRLDPRNTHHYQWSAIIAAATRRYAQAEQTAQAGLSINPRDLTTRSQLAITLMLQGKLDATQDQLELMARQDARAGIRLAPFFLHFRRDPAAALQVAKHVPALGGFENAGVRHSIIGHALLGLGQAAPAQAALDQALARVNAALQAHPNTADLYDSLATIQAYRGNRAAALAAADKAVSLALAPASVDGHTVLPRYIVTKARILAHFNEAKAASDVLRKVLQMPGGGRAISPALLRLDATWDPIRNDLAFTALLHDYPDNDPARAGSTHD